VKRGGHPPIKIKLVSSVEEPSNLPLNRQRRIVRKEKDLTGEGNREKKRRKGTLNTEKVEKNGEKSFGEI